MARQKKKKKKTTVYYTNRVFDAQQDVQQSLVRTVYTVWRILIHPHNFFIHTKGTVGHKQTNTEIIIFFFSVCLRISRGEFVLNDFCSHLNWFIIIAMIHSIEYIEIYKAIFGEERWSYRIFQPSVIHHLLVCVCTHTLYSIYSAGFIFIFIFFKEERY